MPAPPPPFSESNGRPLRRVKGVANFISSGTKIVLRHRRRQYGSVIIKRIIHIVLGPSTALHRPFIERCALTNKAVGTMWRVLSKPPQRRQGPEPRPLWLLVGTPSALGHELASRWAPHSLLLRVQLDISKYITEYFDPLKCLSTGFFYLFALIGCWSSTSIGRIIYIILMCAILITRLLWEWEGSARRPVNQLHKLTVLSLTAIAVKSNF